MDKSVLSFWLVVYWLSSYLVQVCQFYLFFHLYQLFFYNFYHFFHFFFYQNQLSLCPFFHQSHQNHLQTTGNTASWHCNRETKAQIQRTKCVIYALCSRTDNQHQWHPFYFAAPFYGTTAINHKTLYHQSLVCIFAAVGTHTYLFYWHTHFFSVVFYADFILCILVHCVFFILYVFISACLCEFYVCVMQPCWCNKRWWLLRSCSKMVSTVCRAGWVCESIFHTKVKVRVICLLPIHPEFCTIIQIHL